MRQNITPITRNAYPDPLAVLEDQGYRSTEQRRGVVNLLEEKQEGFSAQEACDELSHVGRATVYRTIRLLLEAGVLCKLPLPNGSPKYIMAREEHHHHTICVKCGIVAEFRDSTVERVLRAIGKEIPGEIVSHHMELHLICQACSDRSTG